MRAYYALRFGGGSHRQMVYSIAESEVTFWSQIRRWLQFGGVSSLGGCSHRRMVDHIAEYESIFWSQIQRYIMPPNGSRHCTFLAVCRIM